MKMKEFSKILENIKNLNISQKNMADVRSHKALLAGGLIQTVQRQDPFQNKPLQRGLPKILLFEKLSFLPSCNSQSLENKNIHETKTYSQTLCKAKQALKSPILLSP